MQSYVNYIIALGFFKCNFYIWIFLKIRQKRKGGGPLSRLRRQLSQGESQGGIVVYPLSQLRWQLSLRESQEGSLVILDARGFDAKNIRAARYVPMTARTTAGHFEPAVALFVLSHHVITGNRSARHTGISLFAPSHNEFLFIGTFIDSLGTNHKLFSLIKFYCPCILLVNTQSQRKFDIFCIIQ